MDTLELIVSEVADVGLIMDEILEFELIVGYSIFELEGGHFEDE